MPRIAGRIPACLVLPGGVGRQRRVLITEERVRHITERRPSEAEFCVAHIGTVLQAPAWVGRRLSDERGRVEFVRRVGLEGRLLLVGVKFLDQDAEAWVSTAYPWSIPALTRRLRNGTMWEVSRGS